MYAFVSVSTVDRVLNSTWGDLLKMCNRKIQCPTIPVWWQKNGYCSDMPNVVSAIDGTSHETQIPSNEPQQKNILSANQLFSLIDMKRKFINSDNHKFHQYQ
jgi:hypothetical protein